MTKKVSFKTICLITAGVLALLVALCLVAQSGLFAKEPTVEVKADNCYTETLRVTTDNDYLPYSFYDREGHVSGFDVELITIIANELHMNLDIEFEPWNMGIRSAVDGRTDVLMTCDYLDSFSGTDTLLKSIPVSADDFVVYSKNKIKSIESMFDLKIAVMENGNATADIQMLNLDDNCVKYRTNKMAMAAVEDGKADCAIVRYTVGEAILKELGYRDISAQLSVGQSNMCMGISKDNYALRDRIDAVIETLRANGEMDRLHDKWLTTFVHTYSLKELLLRNIWVVILAALAFAGLILFAIRKEIALTEKQRETEALNDILGSYAAEYDAVYIADFNDGSYRTIKEREGFRSEGSGESIDEVLVKNAENYFYEADREKILKEVADLDSVRREYKVGESRSFEYRRLVEDGYEWYRLTLDRISEGELLVGIKNCNDEISARIAEDTLLDEYDAIYEVNLNRNTIRPARSSRVSAVGAIRERVNYSELAQSFAGTVDPKYRQDWINFSDPEFMKNYMANDEHREYVYELPGTDRVMRRLSVDVIDRIDGVADIVLLSFMGIDDERAKAIRLDRQLAEQQLKMQESNRIITALSEDFGCVNYVQLSDGEEGDAVVNYRTSERLKMLIPGWEEETNFKRKMLLLRDNLVFEEDKERFILDVGRDRILEKLVDEDVYFTDFRLADRGEPLYYQMKFSAVRDQEKLVGVVAGLHSVDEEIRKELDFRKRMDEEQMLLNEVLTDDGVFLVDCVNDTRKTFHDRLSGARNYNDLDSYSTSFSRYVESFVCEPDYETMKAFTDPAYILEALGDRKEMRVRYRDRTRGIQHFYEMKLIRFSDTEVLQSFRETDAEIVNSLLYDNLKDNYFAIFGVDLESGLLRCHKEDPLRIAGGEGEISTLSFVMNKLASYFEGETRTFFEKNSDANYIRERFAEENMEEFFYRSPSGNGRWADVTSIVLSRNADGMPSLFCFAFNYLDERTADGQEMKLQLEEALISAEAANRAKSTFLFNMSHDIRTPMNAILGYTDVALRHQDEPERVDDSLRKIKSSGGHLLNLINDILEMSRIESGKLELSEEPLDIREAIRNVETMSRALAIPMSIDFEVRVGEIRNPYVLSDELHFNEVLINIISNAMKYSREDGRVVYSVDQVSDVQDDGRAWYRVVVEDNGIGMSEEFLGHIFEEFSREKSSTVSRLEGAGLGLSIVKRIVDMAGGTIDIKSRPGAGTTVTVELPIRVMDDEAIAEFVETHSYDVFDSGGIGLEGRRVLLVEDNEMNREIAEEILEEAGLIVETAEDGDIAVRMVFERGVQSFDFILMDIQMPVMNGYDATRAIRRLPDGDRIPIIAVSANAFEEDRQKSLEAGMNAHVAKPINTNELFGILTKCM